MGLERILFDRTYYLEHRTDVKNCPKSAGFPEGYVKVKVDDAIEKGEWFSDYIERIGRIFVCECGDELILPRRHKRESDTISLE